MIVLLQIMIILTKISMKNQKRKRSQKQNYNQIIAQISSVEDRLRNVVEENTRKLFEGQKNILNLLEIIINSKVVPQKMERKISEQSELGNHHFRNSQLDDQSVMKSKTSMIQMYALPSVCQHQSAEDNFAIELYEAEKSKKESYQEQELNKDQIERAFEFDQSSPEIEFQPWEANNIDAEELLTDLRYEFKSMGLSFTEIQTLYEYPRMGHQNYMDRILDKNNILLVMHLVSGQTVGAFTSVNFSSQPVLIPRQNSNAFLFNLTNKHTLYPSKDNKTHSRDSNYLTFGSWEIKLKVGELEFESELGTKADIFKKRSFRGQEVEKRRQWLFGADSELKRFAVDRIGIYKLD